MDQQDSLIPGLVISYLADFPQYLDGIAAWSFEEWGHYFPDETLLDFIRDYQSYLAKDRIPLAVVAHTGREAAGAACLFSNDSLPGFDHLTPWLAAVYVAREFRRQGIGQALVERIVSEAKRLGTAKLYLWTASEAPWYQKQGWRTIATTMFLGHLIDVMELDIE